MGKYSRKFKKGGDGRRSVIMIVILVVAVLIFRVFILGFGALK